MCDIAADYCNLGDYDRCLQLNDSILKIAVQEHADEWLQSYAMERIFWNYYFSKQYTKADSVFSVMVNLDSSFLSINEYVTEAEIKRLINKPDEAIQILNQCENYIKDNNKLLLDTYLSKSYINRDQDDYKKAILYLDSMIMCYNKEVTEIIRQPVALAQRDYYEVVTSNKENLINNLWSFIIAIIVFSCVIIIIGIRFYKLRMKIRDLKISRQLSEIQILYSDNLQNQASIKNYNANLIHSRRTIEKLEKTIEEKQLLLDNLNKNICDMKKSKEEAKSLLNIINEKSGNIEKLKNDIDYMKRQEDDLKSKLGLAFRKQWKTLNLLCDEYYEKADSEKAKVSILKTIEDELKKMKDKKAIDKIENMVNDFMDDIIIRLREQCEFILESDIQFIMLCFAGMSPRTVCFFTGVSLKNYYAKRKRLSDRILKSNAPDKELFAKKLSDKAYKD